MLVENVYRQEENGTENKNQDGNTPNSVYF